MTMISDNLQGVRARITAACTAVGRPPDAVNLLAVSKTFGPDAVAQAFAAGQRAFGENYIQEAVHKMTVLRELPIEWHCIGPVQSNKTRLVAKNFHWMHTVERLKIAQRLSEQRPPGMPALQVCLQVNIDGGENKSGVQPGDVKKLARIVATLPRLKLRGLMCIPELAPDFEASCSVFIKIKALFDDLNAENMGLDTLSIGMSADLEAAIHSGGTLVRIGTAIFGDRPGFERKQPCTPTA
ncbi:MAG: hypothetical protein RL211_1279 [Pseudomonadota bacterium]|jgi:pyridoxal phosphate enzyme (YggS family)